jgi:hypothetical protein
VAVGEKGAEVNPLVVANKLPGGLKSLYPIETVMLERHGLHDLGMALKQYKTGYCCCIAALSLTPLCTRHVPFVGSS